MKSYKDMEWDERVDWAAAYLLKELLAGKFRNGVFMVLSMESQYPMSGKSKRKP